MSLNNVSYGAVPTNSAAEGYARIEEVLLDPIQIKSQKVAVIDGESAYTYEFIATRVLLNAAILTERGLRPGDRAAVYLDKTVEAIIALYSVWAAGGVLVPVNEGLRGRQVQHILRHSGSTCLISDDRKLSGLRSSLLQGLAVVSVDMRLDGAGLPSPLELNGGGEAAAILYTSGSTGLPKGILVSHENLLAGARIVSQYLGIQEDERIISLLPFSFDYGLNQLLTSVCCGATLVLQRSHYPPDICRALYSNEITAMAAVPSLWIQLMQHHSPFLSMSFPRLRYMTNSGGVFPADLVRRYRTQLPHTRIYLMYGLSEAFRSTYLPSEQIDMRPSSIGKAIPETDVYVMNESGNECVPGEIGELVHRGPTVALGYWQDPEASRAVFRRNPFAPQGSEERVVYSGDLGKKDKDGYLYFVGRRDQLIKSYGYRVSPEEVEEVILSSGAVDEVAVCGKPDVGGGAAIVAHVVPRSPGIFSPDQLLGYCRREMPGYMIPKEVRVHSSLPRTLTGKIDRSTLG